MFIIGFKKYIAMKYLILLSLLWLTPFHGFSQVEPQMTILPEQPTVEDTLQVILTSAYYFVNCNYAMRVDFSVDEENNKIFIYGEYCPGQDSILCEDSDTIYIPPLGNNTYDIEVLIGVTGQCPVGNAYYPLDTLNTVVTVDLVSAVRPEFEEVKLALYPNPSADYLVLEQEGLAPHNLLVYDVNGKLVLTALFQESRKRLDIRDLAGGVYLLVLKRRGDQKRRTFRFVVMKEH